MLSEENIKIIEQLRQKDDIIRKVEDDLNDKNTQIDLLKVEISKKSEAIRKDSIYRRKMDQKMREMENHIEQHDLLFSEFIAMKNKLLKKDEEIKSKDLQIKSLKI